MSLPKLEKTYDPIKVEDYWYQHWIDNNYFHADSISKKIDVWKKELIELSSFLETTIDFSDEVVPDESIVLFNKKQ